MSGRNLTTYLLTEGATVHITMVLGRHRGRRQRRPRSLHHRRVNFGQESIATIDVAANLKSDSRAEVSANIAFDLIADLSADFIADLMANLNVDLWVCI